ncbi:60 kDa jasmonate-induced protein [Oryza sativa Japonica Group]|uniref:60 kDa jasmonate-induced protein n=1 Tax=Oryza sativa subsp. japonica TaxID=39947 RepID=UPI0007754867|nr:60 kDa jasmonate-induced protein [Oryza sativa Japonica Group]
MERTVVVENVDYNIMTSNYSDFIIDLQSRLAEHPEQANFHGRPVLARQCHPKQPARWLYINLVGENNDRATLAVRDDNVYLIGFRNLNGKWFHLGFSLRSVPILPEPSTFLECDVTYRSLLGGNVKDVLVRVDVRKISVIHAVHRLSGYAQRRCGVDGATKRDLARLIVVICESARMAAHYNTVNDGWLIRNRQIRLDLWHVDYLWNWGLMSWVVQQQGGKMWPIRLINSGINSIKRWSPTALAMAPPSLPLRVPFFHASSVEEKTPAASTDGDEGSTVDYCVGRLLVEVLAVWSSFDSCTIAVFDGKRGQIIYENHRGDHDGIHDSQGNLMLTGPYRAISADGSFLIEVHTNNAGDVDGTLFWDCYDDRNDHEHDITLTNTINTSLGPVEVTYAVLTDAVEATVQVKLLHASRRIQHRHAVAATIFVYGDITARSECFSVGSVLFSRGSQNKVALTSGSTLLPLSRCVVAVPLNDQVEIEVKLYVGTSSEESINYTFIHRILVFYSGGEQLAQQIFLHGNPAIEVTWTPYF